MAVDRWYRFDKNGFLITGWYYDEATGWWYYLDSGTGEMAIGWRYIGEKWYYLNPVPAGSAGNTGIAPRPQGAMYRNEMTPDGYWVDESGAWVQ